MYRTDSFSTICCVLLRRAPVAPAALMHTGCRWIATFFLGLWLVDPVVCWASDPVGLASVNDVALDAEAKTVKIYGAGGLAGLDAYQSGFFITAQGHILTVWSTVLDVEQVMAVGSDGIRRKAIVYGIDPNLEIAVLATQEPVTHYFDLSQAAEARGGERVLALSNLYGIATGNEMSSVLKGVVMAITDLAARRGAFDSIYQGPVYVVDAMTNNPGAAGGALVNLKGQLLGMLGKELRDTRSGTWLNYALPVSQISGSVQQILAGDAIGRVADNRQPADRPMSLAQLGIVLVPNLLARTPNYVDLVQPESAAAKAGLRSDDLILFINSARVSSQDALNGELHRIDEADSIVMLVQRGSQLVEVSIAER